MDGQQFDDLARRLSHSRRALLGLGAAFGAAPLLADAKKKKKKKKKDKDKDGCEQNCGGGTLCCSGRCVNVVTDRQNCGACGTVCPTGQFCANTKCVPCEDPFALCTGLGEERCVDLRSDRQNCGSCEFRCFTDPTTPARNFICEAKQCVCTGNVCEDGRCCPAGYTVCTAGGGCCPDGHKYCPNNPDGGKCCPANYTCGGRCGQNCCAP